LLKGAGTTTEVPLGKRNFTGYSVQYTEVGPKTRIHPPLVGEYSPDALATPYWQSREVLSMAR
jgi:hypothetical protein